MGRVAIANRKLEKNLQKILEDKDLVYGLIIGQPTIHGKDYIIHLARTPESSKEILPELGLPLSNLPVDSVTKIDTQTIVNHALSVTRLIPGSFFVLGIFVASKSNLFEDIEASKKVKDLLYQIFKVLSDHKLFHANPIEIDNGEKLVLSYTTLNKMAICKSFNCTSSTGSFNPADWKFVDKTTHWHMFDTSYEIDEIFPIIKTHKSVNIEHNLSASLESIENWVQNSVIFVQNEYVDTSMLLENYIKERQKKKENMNNFKASIYLPAMITDPKMLEITKFHGTMHYSGLVYSKIWAQPKNTLEDIQKFIRNDVLRSLAARVQIYCDALSEPISHIDDLVISEPPRRIFFEIPECDKIEFSEYIFRGENVEIAVEQAKELLDLEIDSESLQTDFENVPEVDISATESSNGSQITVAPKESTKSMYIAGIAVTILIVILAVLLHFIFR